MAAQRPKVIYWNNIPSPYTTVRFDALADRGNLDFEAWFNVSVESDRPWEIRSGAWRFPYRYLPSVAVGSRRLSLPTQLLGHSRPDLLVSLYAEPSFLLGWLLARQRGLRTAFWCEVTHDHILHRHWAKEALKRQLFRRVDGVTTAGQEGVAFARKYGAPPERVFAIGHSFDQPFFSRAAEAARPDRENLRCRLGLQGTVFLYVGRFLWLKGLGHLLDAFGVLQRRAEGAVSLLLVGNGPEETALRRQCLQEGLRNVVFLPFQQQSELPRYYAAADVFVFPTLGDTYGLVVDEAMACSLPVISTDAAGEIHERIEDGENGYIVRRENSAALLDRMETLARDPELRDWMGTLSAQVITKYAPERWAEKFECAVDRILSMPRAGSETRITALPKSRA